MLDMGFEPDIRRIVAAIPSKEGARQTVMFRYRLVICVEVAGEVASVAYLVVCRWVGAGLAWACVVPFVPTLA